MKILKTTTIIIAITLLLVALVNAGLGWVAKKAEKANEISSVPVYELPNYSNASWAKTHFDELRQQQTAYKSYVGWRRNAYSGETINVDGDGYRFNPDNRECPDGKPEVWFFGGSTMWGEGAADQFTIPEFFAQKQDKYCVRNLGESDWRSRQEMALLVNLLFTEKKPAAVVFYDGVNDCYNGVIHKAQGMRHHYEEKIRKAQEQSREYERLLKNKSVLKFWARAIEKKLWSVFLDGTIRFIRYVKHGQELQENASMAASLEDIIKPCDLGAEQLALIDSVAGEQAYNYTIIQEICRMRGIEFIAILQPNAWVGSPYMDHMVPRLATMPKCSATVYEKYYETVRQKLNGLPYFYDLSNAFDSQQPIYIDHCHVSSDGNEIMASEIVAIMNKVGML